MDERAQIYIYEYKNERFKLFKLIADLVWASMGILAIVMLIATFMGNHIMTEFISILIGG